MSFVSDFLGKSHADRDNPVLLLQADRDVASRATPGLWSGLGLIPILLFATRYAFDHTTVLMVFTAAVLGLTIARRNLVRQRAKLKPELWRRRVTLVFALTGLTWGVFVPVTFFFYGHTGIEGLMSIIWVAGTCPSVISILAPHLTASRLYLAAAILPGVLGELFLIPDSRPPVAFLLAIFLLYMIELSNAAHRSYWNNLKDNELLKARAKELESARSNADHANRSKSDLLARVTEEIRQPLYDIIGLSAGLLDAELPPEPVDQLRNVKYSADSLLHRVSDLHDYATLESGQIQFESASFQLQEAVGMALRALKPAADAKGLEFHAQIDEEVPRKVTGDPWRLQQLLSNLVSNAIKFTEAGEVTVDIRLDSREGADAVILFVVTDTGPGIPAAQQETLFQAFSRFEPGQPDLAGAGLGLPIAARIASLTGGKIWIESDAGTGTKVYATTRVKADDSLVASRFRTLPVVA